MLIFATEIKNEYRKKFKIIKTKTPPNTMNAQAIARQEVEQYILENFEEGANGGKRTIEKEIGDEYLEINFEYDGHYRLISGNYDHPDYCEYEVEYQGKAYIYDEDGNLTSETAFDGFMSE